MFASVVSRAIRVYFFTLWLTRFSAESGEKERMHTFKLQSEEKERRNKFESAERRRSGGLPVAMFIA